MEGRKIVVTGIGTDVGKTVVSAILAEALKASYWKPVQAGDLDNSDTKKIERYTEQVNILPEAFRLSEPMSPHAAARIDGIQINQEDISVPDIEGNLIIEGAGGLMVPINDNGLTYADVFEEWKLPVIIVSRHYLGSINHTLLTCEVLKARGVEIIGIIFVGDQNVDTESVILESTGLRQLARIPMAKEVNKAFIQEQAARVIF